MTVLCVPVTALCALELTHIRQPLSSEGVFGLGDFWYDAEYEDKVHLPCTAVAPLVS